MNYTSLLLLFCLSVTRLCAQEAGRPYGELYHPAGVPVSAVTVLQFFGSRCAERREFVADLGQAVPMGILDSLVGLPKGTPFTVYHQCDEASEMLDISSGELNPASSVPLPMPAGTYYVLFFGDGSPTLLRYAPATNQSLLLVGCALHLPLPEFVGY